jgi:long-subunit fatty acid transport protein
MRNDADYTISFGASYAFTKHFNMGVTYAYEMGRNLLSNYSAAPATTSSAAYRSFDHQLISLAAQYKF